MKAQIGTTVGIGTLLAILFLSWWVARNASRSPASLNIAPRDRESLLPEMRNGRLIGLVPERQEEWVLTFQKGRYDPDRKEAVVETAICQVIRRSERVAVFRAPRIQVFFDEKRMMMTGGVTVRAVGRNWQVRLPSAVWNWGTGDLSGTGPVRMEGQHVVAIGKALSGNTNDLQVTLVGEVQVQWLRL
ncbi:MAG: LPS export ABC transporter periplasmic protein LptC [Armatimonadetes bacterium]|nr:LPS export ABC transporter periplasmic protein LptC [Armatimonadota bacterium]MDW8120803.1 LPS export ABC transporter periplasmic protein LptC [Armatimonadota bacterium]